MKTNELKKSTFQFTNTTNINNKQPIKERKRLKTFADIKHHIDGPIYSTTAKNNRPILDKKMVKGHKRFLHRNNHHPFSSKNPSDYFRCQPPDMSPETLETQLYDDFFSLPCIQSITSKSEDNIEITESYEFVEMNNNSIRISRVFRSQLSNSFKTSINREDMINTKKKPMDVHDDKENFRNEEQKIFTQIQNLKRNIQFSALDTPKKQNMMKGLVGLEDILNSSANFKDKYLSQESFGNYLCNRRQPNSIQGFKNTMRY